MSLQQLASDLKAAVLFCTRLPIPHAAAITGADLARAGWAFPVAGAVVGLIAAAVYWLAGLASLPALPAAGLAVAATLVVTGCRPRGVGLGSRRRPHGGSRRHAAVHATGSSCPDRRPFRRRRTAVGGERPGCADSRRDRAVAGAWPSRRRLRHRPAGGGARIAGMALTSADRRPNWRCSRRRGAVRRGFDPAGRSRVPARMMRPETSMAQMAIRAPSESAMV